jgi:branched-chain amino acid transport system substrate-binding protein
MMRKVIAGALVGAVAMGAVACGSDSPSSPSPATIKIGVLLSETGPAAAQGQVQRRGVELVLDQVNQAGGVKGRKVEAVFEDDGSSPDRAVDLVKKLASDDVVAIIGPSFAGTCGAVQPLIEREGIFTYCLSGAQFKWTPHFFAAAPPPADSLGNIPMEWASEKGYSKVACLATTDVSGDGYIANLGSATTRLGLDLTVEKYATGDPSVQTQLAKVRAGSPDLIYSCASGANLVTVAKGMIALGMEQPVLAGLGSVGQPVAQAIKGTLPPGGIYALASWIDVPGSIPAGHPNRQAILDYAAAYEKNSGSLPDRASADAADGLSLVLKAIESGASDSSAIAKYIETLDTYDGIAGTYSSFAADNHRGLTPEKVIVRFTTTGAFEFVKTLS